MFKRARIPLVSYGNILSPNASDQGVFIDPRAPRHTEKMRAHDHPCKRWNPQIRGFANVRSDSCSSSHTGNPSWPELSSATTVPTPYQIFQLDKNATYSKHRFYELVKLYHPDRHHSEQSLSDRSPISSDVRIERYRLVVAANDILSDPVKRSAYDRYGLGWGRHTEAPRSKYNTSYRHHTKRSRYYTDESPMKNATWEDWERWYQRHSRGKQEPIFFSNGTLLSMIVALAALVGAMQGRQMGESSFVPLAHVEAVTKECNKNIRSRRTASREFDNKYERLHSFLESRAPHGNGMLEPKDDVQTRLLPPPDYKAGFGNDGYSPNSQA